VTVRIDKNIVYILELFAAMLTNLLNMQLRWTDKITDESDSTFYIERV